MNARGNTNHKTFDFQFINPVKTFTGREEVLRKLHEALKSEKKMAMITQAVSVTGLGGIGKTELARKYAYDYQKEYKNRIFIGVENRENAETSFKKLASKLEIKITEKVISLEQNKNMRERDLKSIVQDIYERLSENGDKTLLILDNVEDYEAVKDFIPKCNSQSFKSIYTIITSRYTDWDVGEDGKIVELTLNIFKSSEALKYVKNEMNEKETVGVEKLIETLGYLPLALKQAKGFIKEQNKKPKCKPDSIRVYTAEDYVKEFEIDKEKLLKEGNDKNYERYNKTIFNTWTMTFTKISNEGDCGKLAIKMLNIMAYLSPENIDVKTIFARLDSKKLLSAIDVLKKYSMINFEDGFASVHRLVQEVIRINLKNNGEKLIIEKTLSLLNGTECDEHVIAVWTYASQHADIVRKCYPDAKYCGDLTPIHILARYQDDTKVIESIIKNVDNFNIDDKKDADVSILFQAVINNRLIVVEFLLKEGASTNMDENVSELHIAVNKNYIKMVKLLISHNIDLISKKNYENLTPIAAAIINGNEDIVKMLVPQNNELYLHYTGFSRSLIENNTEQSKEMIKINAINQKIEDLTYLILAAKNGSRKIIRYLIRQGADVNLENDFKENALHHYIKYNEIVDDIIIKALIEKGINVDSKNYYGKTPLHLAVKNKHLNIVKVLLDNEASVEAVDDNLDTPLHCASVFSDADIAIVLIEKGASIECKNADGDTPLHIASIFGNTHVMKVLIDKNADINSINNSGDTPIQNATIRGKSDAVEFLIKKGANISIKGYRGQTPLHRAVIDTHLNIVKLLLDNGASVEAVDDNLDTPLHCASVFSDADIAIVLIDKGAEIEIKNVNGDTPLHIASHEGSTHVMKVLIDKNADINSINNSGDTPIQNATIRGKSDAVEFLLKHGVNISIKGYQGQTPLHRAVIEKHLDMVRLLLDNGATVEAEDDNLNTALHRASKLSDADIAIVLIEKGANIETKNADGDTPLHIASFYGNTPVIQVLLDKEANINATSNFEETPCHFAAKNDKPDAIKLLLEYKADITLKNRCGNTVLHLAVEKNNVSAVQILVDNDCDIFAINNCGETPLDIASRKDFSEIVEILVNIKNSIQTMDAEPLNTETSAHKRSAADTLIASQPKKNAN
ncbi:uncharacterized protein LOC143921515 [Arctopsyche grandis]|uniref:uncharacterized protein LOC143921515 n=1 Tax=Arctopsyche grandis TaxID=121162 RepID=UPI00406D68C3